MLLCRILINLNPIAYNIFNTLPFGIEFNVSIVSSVDRALEWKGCLMYRAQHIFFNYLAAQINIFHSFTMLTGRFSFF